jgi:hypothetical protein
MAEVRLENVRKAFGKVMAVKDFSLDIPEFVAAMGSSHIFDKETGETLYGAEGIRINHLQGGER